MFDNFPEFLRGRGQWCLWRYETRDDGSITKVPYRPFGKDRKASSDKPRTWATFNRVVEWFNEGGWDGIGVFVAEDDNLTFIDFDDPWKKKPDGSFVHADPDAIAANHQKLIASMDTYTETSPSGLGVHCFVWGKISHGRRHDGIEMYSRGRFFTVTGKSIHNPPKPIREWDLLEGLWAQLRPESEGANVDFSQMGSWGTATRSDFEICEAAKKAANGELFMKLYRGEWQTEYESQSEADQALSNIIQYYTQDRLQIANIFHASELGKRAKAGRSSYLTPTINKSFDQAVKPVEMGDFIAAVENEVKELDDDDIIETIDEPLPTVDMSGFFLKMEKELSGLVPSAAQKLLPAGVVFDRTTPATPPPLPEVPHTPLAAGVMNLDQIDVDYYRKFPPTHLLRLVVDYIYNSSPRPNYDVSLVGALALLAGITGRAYNISNSGLNHYFMLLGVTGVGKEAAGAGINRIVNILADCPDPRNNLLRNEAIRQFLGPSQIASGQAVAAFLASMGVPVCVSVLGEFGYRLKQITDPRASSADSTLMQVLLRLYSLSGYGNQFNSSIYAEKAKNYEPVKSPAFTLLGEGTPDMFYEALDDMTVANGFIPRLTIVEVDQPLADFNVKHETHELQFSVIAQLLDLIRHVQNLQASRLNTMVVRIGITPEAADMLSGINKFCEIKLRKADGEAVRHVWNRVHLKIIKLAGLLAVGENFRTPCVNDFMVMWATSLVVKDARRMLRKFDKGEIGQAANSVGNQEEYIRRVLRKYFEDGAHGYKGVDWELHEKKFVRRSWLQQRCIGHSAFKREKPSSAQAFNQCIKNMCDNGLLAQVPPVQSGREGQHIITIRDVAWFMREPD